MIFVQKCFKEFQDQIQLFYGDSNRQKEFRMQLNEMDEGNFVVAYKDGTGNENGTYFRGRIDEINQEFCYVFDIDECEFLIIKLDKIYHIDSQFTLRHPRVRNTLTFN